MTEDIQCALNHIELDPHLLATPFGLKTNWHVITGGPSCGKTTLIDLLAEKGYRTVPEGARLYLEREIARGRTIEEIRSNMDALQRGVKDMHLAIERGLRADEFLFLDRAVPDCLAWFRVFGLDPNELLPDCFHHRYASVFMLEQLPLKLNGLRFDDDAIAGFTQEWHMRDYLALGYDIVVVPVLPPKERVAFILERLSSTVNDQRPTVNH